MADHTADKVHRRCHILYVSPNQPDYRLIVEVLHGDTNVSVGYLPTGHAILEHLKQHPEYARPNLIVLGSRLPDVTALELVTQLKSDLELRTIPIVVVLSDLPPEAVDKLYDAGAACVAKRPDNLDELTEFIRATKSFWVDQAILPFCGTYW